MTRREYKKARSALIHVKGTRIFMWIRLFMTLVAFLLSLVFSVVEIAGATFAPDAKNFLESDFGESLLLLALMLLMEPISLFSFVFYGAYSSLGVSEAMSIRNTNWISSGDRLYVALVIAAFVVGFIVLWLLFRALKSTKVSSGGFVLLTLILILDSLVCLQHFGLDFSAGDFLPIFVYASNLISLFMCFRAIFCVKYLNESFYKGASMSVHALDNKYRQNVFEDSDI